MSDPLKTAEAYYVAMRDKKFDEMADCLHPRVEFVGPLATMHNRDAVVEAAKNFSFFFQNLSIEEKFQTGDKVVLILDLGCPPPVGKFRSASFLSFEEGLISKIELFYDARPFDIKKSEIFSNA